MDLLYIVPYEPMYKSAMDGIRKDGWLVKLKTDATGELSYGIYSKAVDIAASHF